MRVGVFFQSKRSNERDTRLVPRIGRFGIKSVKKHLMIRIVDVPSLNDLRANRQQFFLSFFKHGKTVSFWLWIGPNLNAGLKHAHKSVCFFLFFLFFLYAPASFPSRESLGIESLGIESFGTESLGTMEVARYS